MNYQHSYYHNSQFKNLDHKIPYDNIVKLIIKEYEAREKLKKIKEESKNEKDDNKEGIDTKEDQDSEEID